MGEEKKIVVEYRREGEDRHILALGSKAIPEVKIDYTGIPIEERAGTAQRLLAAAALYCFASTLGSALSARNVVIYSLTGKATSEKEKDDYYRTKVSRIQIDIQLDVPEKDLPTLEKVEKFVENGCLITYSIGQGIEVEHSIRRIKNEK